MSALFQFFLGLLMIAGLLAAVAALFYGFSWAVLSLVQFFPTIGRKHRHQRWDELTRRSARGRPSDSRSVDHGDQ